MRRNDTDRRHAASVEVKIVSEVHLRTNDFGRRHNHASCTALHAYNMYMLSFCAQKTEFIFCSLILTTVLLLLERTCQCSGQLVRHTLHLADNLHPKALAKEIAEYREVGWRVCVLWRGAKSRPKIHNATLCL